MSQDLDTFETALLRELRATVAHRSSLAATTATPLPHRARRTRRAVASALAAGSAATLAVVGPGLLVGPAYAVEDGPAGTVDVEVARLEDASGLEQALAEHGIAAVVEYLDENQGCSPGRYRPADSAPGSATTFSVGEGVSLVLDLRDVSHGETVVIAASRVQDGVHAEVGIAAGSVGACEVVPLVPEPGS